MHTKSLLFSLLFTASSVLMANPVYQPAPPSSTHHEVTGAGVGLVAGSLIAGPFGAIIGGSMGVLTGHQQTKNETITEQQYFITELEQDIAIVNSELSQSKIQITQLEKHQRQLEDDIQHYTKNLDQFLDSYQFDIYFLSNSTTIQEHALEGLDKLVKLLESNPDLEARIESHTDWRGTNDDNFQLAENRLAAVTHYLSLNGADKSQFMTTIYGEEHNTNKGSWGEALFYDRRVTITLSFFGY